MDNIAILEQELNLGQMQEGMLFCKSQLLKYQVVVKAD